MKWTGFALGSIYYSGTANTRRKADYSIRSYTQTRSVSAKCRVQAETPAEDMGSQEREGIGAHAMWGYTPAKDLLHETPLSREANILVCQPGDIGHILRTISTRRRHPQHTINLYVWESQIEVLARHLLLLQVVHAWELPIRQRANIFLEIFGNSSVQERTSRYIARLGKGLVDMLFSTEAMADVIDLSLLKSRQRDQLEATFRSWACDVSCNIQHLRDYRLRNFFGTRYDHRKNLVDWDYTNRLKEVASIIHHTQYRKWRLEGTAYEFGDQVYDQPNRTMISYAEGTMTTGKHRGMNQNIRGFWLDVRVGPFVTFGVDCDRPNKYAEELFAVLNKGTGTEQHRHNTAEVAVYSIISYLWEMEAHGPYMMTKKNDIYSGLGEENGSVESGDASGEGRKHKVDQTSQETNAKGSGEVEKAPRAHHAQESDNSRNSVPCNAQGAPENDAEGFVRTDDRTEAIRKEQAAARAQCIVETFDGVKIFLLGGDISQHLSKSRFHRVFDRVHMGLTAVDVASNANINEALADRAVMTMDTGRYMIPFTREQQTSFMTTTCTLAHDRGWEPLFDSVCSSDEVRIPAKEDGLLMDHLRFSYDRKPAYA